MNRRDFLRCAAALPVAVTLPAALPQAREPLMAWDNRGPYQALYGHWVECLKLSGGRWQ
jgi:hypothetical protein